MLMSMTKPGLMDASAIPRKNRFVASPPKELHPAVVITIIPWTVSDQYVRIKVDWELVSAGERLTYCDTSKVLANWQLLHRIPAWILSKQVPKVEDGTRPRIILSCQIVGRLQSEDRCEIDALLVEILQPIC